MEIGAGCVVGGDAASCVLVMSMEGVSLLDDAFGLEVPLVEGFFIVCSERAGVGSVGLEGVVDGADVCFKVSICFSDCDGCDVSCEAWETAGSADAAGVSIAATTGVAPGVCEDSAVGALVVLCEADADAAPGRRPTFGLKARPPVFFNIELIVSST